MIDLSKNTSVLRTNMVEQQIRTWDVLDDRILNLYYDLPRENFVTSEQKTLAYVDSQLPCGENQVMLEPKLEARILQELEPQNNERILHIGTGSGYFAALLGMLSGEVTSVEILPKLAQFAEAKLSENGISNVTVKVGDGFAYSNQERFDALVLTGSVPTVPEKLLELLIPERARIIALVGSEPIATLQRIRKTGNHLAAESIVDAWVPTLQNAPKPSKFIF